MKNHRRAIFLAIPIVLTGLFGCAATLESEGLQIPADRVRAHLEAGASYAYGGSTNSRFEVGVLPGDFTLELKSATGQYYLADAPSVWWKAAPDKFLVLKKAGIWIPFDRTQPARIYFYNHAGHAMLSSLDELKSLKPESIRTSISAGQSDVVDVVASQAALQSRATPLQAGVGAGLGAGVVTAIVEYDRNVPVFHPAPVSPAFGAHISKNFVLGSVK